MRGKLLFVAGAAIGYVVGTRQGRQGYEKLKHQAADAWRSPRVQRSVASAQDFVRDNVPIVGDKVADAVDKLTADGDRAAADVVDGPSAADAARAAERPADRAE